MNKSMRFTVLLSLIGLNLAWIIFMLAMWWGLGEEPVYNVSYSTSPEIKVSTYLFLVGIAAFNGFASWAHGRADNQRLQLGEDNRAANATFRFATLSVIIGLVAGAVFAITTFLASFNGSFNTTVVGRIFGVYLPIVLTAALVVFVLLRATVFRKSSNVESGEKGKLTDEQRALVLGYSLPIVGTAVATILGIVVYDAQGRSLDIWAWVVIQVIIALSIVFGTRFAVQARAGKPAPVRAKTTLAGAAGAVSLNFVLSIIFGAAVTLMSFTFGSDAISLLRSYRSEPLQAGESAMTILPITPDWFFGHLLPAYLLLLLAAFGVYATLVSRHFAGKDAPAKTPV
jgi:MFS family permease